MFWVNVFVAAGIAVCLYQFYTYDIPHTYYNQNRLKPDACIINIRHEKDSFGRSKYIKTIIVFSDGFEYHTHKCRAVPGLGFQTLYVNSDVLEIIKKKAYKAHRKAVSRK